MKFTLPLALAGTMLLASCASIVSKSRYPVAISSVPTGADVVITDRDGKEVFKGVAPTSVVLKSGAGYFRRATYKLNFSKPGFDSKTLTLESDVNGWYFGNLLFGGLIGMLIVDPATGAMYRIAEKDMQASLATTTAQGFYVPSDAKSLQIVSLDDVPTSLRDKMVPVQ